MQVIFTGFGDYSINQGVIELAFFRLELSPLDANQNCIQVAAHKLRPYRLHGLESGGGVVAQFPGEDQEWLSVHHQLGGIALFCEMGNVGRCLSPDQTWQASGTERQTGEKHHTDAHSSLLEWDGTGNPSLPYLRFI